MMGPPQRLCPPVLDRTDHHDWSTLFGSSLTGQKVASLKTLTIQASPVVLPSRLLRLDHFGVSFVVGGRPLLTVLDELDSLIPYTQVVLLSPAFLGISEHAPPTAFVRLS